MYLLFMIPVCDKPILMVSDLPCLKIGDVGDQVQAIVLCFYSTPLPTVMLAPNDEIVVRAIQEDLLERVIIDSQLLLARC